MQMLMPRCSETQFTSIPQHSVAEDKANVSSLLRTSVLCGKLQRDPQCVQRDQATGDRLDRSGPTQQRLMLRHLSKALRDAGSSQVTRSPLNHDLSAAKGIVRTVSISSTARQQEANTSGAESPAASPAPATSASTAAALPTQAIWSDVPPPARLLGLAGVIPFIALSPPIAASLPLLPAELVQNAGLLQVAYGASICSFLGGIHWAMAMAEYGGKQASARMGTDRYVWSVTPCLMAWPAVIMSTGPASLAIASVLGIVHAVDGRFAQQKLLPPWYMVLRRPLSAFAISGMLITLVGSLLYPQAQQQHAQPVRQNEQISDH